MKETEREKEENICKKKILFADEKKNREGKRGKYIMKGKWCRTNVHTEFRFLEKYVDKAFDKFLVFWHAFY